MNKPVKKKINETTIPEKTEQKVKQTGLTEAGINILEQFEGRRNQAYDDATGQPLANISQAMGYPTIGVGHLLTEEELKTGQIEIGGKKIDWRNGLTDEQIDELVRQDTKKAEQAVEKHVNVPLTPPQRDALISFAFNIGEEQFRTAGAIKALNRGDTEEFLRRHAQWRKSSGQVVQGLINRRQAEAELFRSGMA